MIHISEVGPRDGLQNEKKILPIETKVKLINQLVNAGIKKVECVSFVNPKIVKQMADAEDVLKQIERDPSVSYGGLVLSQSGVERALKTEVDFLNVAMASSDTFNLKNSKRTVEDSLKELSKVIHDGVTSGIKMIGVVGTSFGCPYEGRVSQNKVLKIAEKFLEVGCKEITFADTTGMANPNQVSELVDEFYTTFGKEITLALHFHNTRGLGLANTLAGYQAGVRHFDSSVGGLGGCPFAPKAVGNVCTEDMVNMFHQMGIETGTNLDKLIEIAQWLEVEIGHELDGMLMKAGSS
ncbi:hydroxymethylglutaryl-CoA lyase [Alkalihalobacterium alkalinitrilicum]|uniref:hydroxymethylglutaryl-CoA lyase n=1 Tax=Alkalihalobacterium alkalinitrilicum TaxID=427920 RepID=UPI0009949817|nr:hydroxymethylglutaryl-CoA lyase [Alkalihalobacterium alkalinitrilicum]